MTTALIISELLPFHDDALLADIDHIFDEIDRSVAKTPPDEAEEIMLIVDWLVDEMLAPAKSNELSIELEVELGAEQTAARQDDEVAEVA
jgi:hypothetical protein